MSRPATSRLKVNPPLGNLPALQYLLPQQLKIDATYQRNLETGQSISLIRKIAMFWNWDLCQPLVVARRATGEMFVIDGQHRLEAARLRGDIAQLPAVVVSYESAADEAASFVHLNQQRRPLSKLDVFKAAVASGDEEAVAITKALSAAGLGIAATTNSLFWKPGQVINIGGIERSWRAYGPTVTAGALRALSQAYSGQVLSYAGTIFPGIAFVCASKTGGGNEGFARFVAMLSARSQNDWRGDMMRLRGAEPNLKYGAAMEKVIADAWEKCRNNPIPIASPTPKPAAALVVPTPDGKRWCDQCERRVHLNAAALCKSKHCKLRPALSAA